MAPKSESPTLPLPPPRSSITFEEFVEAATAAALRAAQTETLASPNLSPPRRPIWIGIIIDPQVPRAVQAATAD